MGIFVRTPQGLRDLPSLGGLVWFLGLYLWSALAFAQGQGQQPPKRGAAELMDSIMWNREPVGGAFRLTDHHGRIRRDTDFRGKLMLVYFGYTSCPDICPTDLQAIGLALERLGTAAAKVAPIFITLDPERDTRKHLSKYLASFHGQLIGLTGSSVDIRRVADNYRVFYEKVFVSGSMRYTIDHSSFIYLIGSEGQYLGFIPPGTPADRMVNLIRPLIATSLSR